MRGLPVSDGEQAPTRAHAKPIEWDHIFQLVKVNPLVRWTWADVLDLHQGLYEVPYNEMHDRNYPGIGCIQCTKPVMPGDDPRSGRWERSRRLNAAFTRHHDGHARTHRQNRQGTQGFQGSHVGRGQAGHHDLIEGDATPAQAGHFSLPCVQDGVRDRVRFVHCRDAPYVAPLPIPRNSVS